MVQAFAITTKADLIDVFRAIGLSSGQDVMVHAAMSCLGYVVNGALDVIDALIETIGLDGTLLMPAHTGQLTDPAGWTNPPIPQEHIETVRHNMRPFDRQTTPIRNRGVIPQTLLTYSGVKRSSHPLNSVIARGARASYFTAIHNFSESEGWSSPIGKLYTIDGFILLIGVSLNSCTAIHLAEFIADVPYLKETRLKVLVHGQDNSKAFVPLERYPSSSEHFIKLRSEPSLGHFFKEVDFRFGKMLFFPLRPIIDFTVAQLSENPYYLITPA